MSGSTLLHPDSVPKETAVGSFLSGLFGEVGKALLPALLPRLKPLLDKLLADALNKLLNNLGNGNLSVLALHSQDQLDEVVAKTSAELMSE